MEATEPEPGTAAAPGSLREDLRQTRPFRSVSEEAVLALLRTSNAVSRHISIAIEPFGITSQQYNVLRILRGAAEAGLPTLDIAARMLERTPGITRLIDKLEARGLAARKRGPDDRRQVLCFITASGRDLLSSITPGVDARVDESLRPLGTEEAAYLIGVLAKIRNALP